LKALTESQLFDENIYSINRMIGRILTVSSIVPIAFFIFSKIGIWKVPDSYALSVFAYCILVSLTAHILNKYPQMQLFTMYFSLFAAIVFVDLLGYKSVITITISYGFAPVLSCFYYNKRLTRIINGVNFVTILGVNWVRSKTILDNFIWIHRPDRTPEQWFIENGIGLVIEFFFVYLITITLATRTNKTLVNLLRSSDERNIANEELKKRNDYIVKINSEIETQNQQLTDTQYKIIQFVAQVLGSHDLFTGRHVMHTRKYVEVIAKELRDEGYYTKDLTDENITLYSTAAFLHDIGKIHIPEGVLNKIGKFTPEEFQLMKIHPEEGKKLLEYLPKIENGKFNVIAKEMAYCHHEKWDGSGYPNGISGKDIPLSARIMAAADVLDALISQRLYKEPMSIDEAIDVFRKARGIHFEPCIADAVINLRNLISIIDDDFKTSEASTNAAELEWWQNYHAKTVKWEVTTEISNQLESE